MVKTRGSAGGLKKLETRAGPGRRLQRHASHRTFCFWVAHKEALDGVLSTSHSVPRKHHLSECASPEPLDNPESGAGAV